MTTKLLYLTDSYKKTCHAKIMSLDGNGGQVSVVLDHTIFYPQGGGQLSDQGSISGPAGQIVVSQALFQQTTVVHHGTLHGTLEVGDRVELTLDWPLRYIHMQQHTAGHILDEAVKSLYPEVYGVSGSHSIGHRFCLTFSGLIDETKKDEILDRINEIRADNEPIATQMMTKADIIAAGIRIPFKLPENKPLRVITIGSRQPIPDGGTQLKSTGELWPVTLGSFSYENNQTTIHYQVVAPPQKAGSIPSQSRLNLAEFLRLNQDILLTAQTVKSWDTTTVSLYLGKNGLFNQNLASQIRFLADFDKREGGKILNQTKTDLQNLVGAGHSHPASEDFLDVTKPGTLPPIGHLHPITAAIAEITQIFKGIGFTRVRYPEVDYDHYVFTNLNMPANHPARDEWETFFIDAPPHPTKGGLVLTTHTSNGQVREMERVKTPPIRMLNLGKCYRRQQDVTHTAMFHQFEGLVIDRGITIQHLKGTLDYFARKFYGPTAVSRIRPFMFKFTEPSFEVDFSCTNCQGTGKQGEEKCRFCKSGWHEVGGAGMVHPNVLRAGGIDPEIYQGFAFGWGVERVYTLKPGLHLDDIRPLYSTNVQFLNQF